MNVTAIVPVKPWGLSKSRLTVGHAFRPKFARAFALDVLDQVTAAEHITDVIVVTAEPELGAVARRLGAVLLTDRPMLAGGMLNVAIDVGRRWAMSRYSTDPLLVVPADLAALTAPTLDAAIEQLDQHDVAFVPDRTGRGTTLTWTQDPARMRPFYGVDSARRHAEDGAATVIEVDTRVRQDVDTDVDLREVRHLGLGRHTTEVLAEFEAARLVSARKAAMHHR
jgi:2-phospho-L-lactate guanylyltransferase